VGSGSAESDAISDFVAALSFFDSGELINPERYRTKGYPHAEWAFLRKHHPVFRVECAGVSPFWAITKAADIIEISREPKLWASSPRFAIFSREPGEQQPANPLLLKHLVNMDPPQHGIYRSLLNRQFTPRSVRALASDIEQITRELFDDMAGESRCDFVTDLAAKIPIAAIARILGVPRHDWDQLFDWTNQIAGRDDPEFQKNGGSEETYRAAALQAFQYFTAMVEKRRQHPTSDIVSVLANSNIDGQPVPPLELMSYLLVLIVAGNETSRNAMSGGLLALIDNPEQFDRIRSEPSLTNSAVEEILRWTSPGIQFARTATRDTEVRGQKIAAGESVCLFYPSANRDEDVFERPFEFDIGRSPNPHLAFGVGEHFCLGASLARLELQVVFRHLSQKMKEVELDGPIERLRSSFVGGIKHMPIRFRLSRGEDLGLGSRA
jgi:cholest-4-en-3-one 26-monooxygenase